MSMVLATLGTLALCCFVMTNRDQQFVLARVLVVLAGLIYGERRQEFAAELAYLQSDVVGATGLDYALDAILGAAAERAVSPYRLFNRGYRLAGDPDHGTNLLRLAVPEGSVVGLIAGRSIGRATISPVAAVPDGNIEDLWVCVDERQSAADRQPLHLGDNLIDSLTVYENIAVVPTSGRRQWLIGPHRQRERAKDVLARIGAPGINPERLVRDLTRSERAMVAMAAALHSGQSVVVVDDPHLSAPSMARISDALERLRSEGIGVLFLSHDVTEICRIADRVTVLREGAVALEVDAKRISPAELVRQLVADTED